LPGQKGGEFLVVTKRRRQGSDLAKKVVKKNVFYVRLNDGFVFLEVYFLFKEERIE